MKRLTIKKSMDINASKADVWVVLTENEYTTSWYAEFNEGSHAETDWKIGSKAIFKDNSNCGLIGKIVANEPHEMIAIEYIGIVEAGIEDYESKIAQNVKGGLETYHLTRKEDATHLAIQCDMDEDFFESMSLAWDKALRKIKSLSESKNIQVRNVSIDSDVLLHVYNNSTLKS